MVIKYFCKAIPETQIGNTFSAVSKDRFGLLGCFRKFCGCGRLRHYAVKLCIERCFNFFRRTTVTHHTGDSIEVRVNCCGDAAAHIYSQLCQHQGAVQAAGFVAQPAAKNVQRISARQNTVEHHQRQEVRVARAWNVIRNFKKRSLSVAGKMHAALPTLFRFGAGKKPWRVTRRNFSKQLADARQHLGCAKISNRHNDCIAGHVMFAVVLIQVRALHALDVRLVTQHFMMIGMHAERRSLQLFAQQKHRAVLRPLAL